MPTATVSGVRLFYALTGDAEPPLALLFTCWERAGRPAHRPGRAAGDAADVHREGRSCHPDRAGHGRPLHPVSDATVTIALRSLGADGGPTAAALATGPGRYEVANVPLGIAGPWEAKVSVAQPGEAPASFVFTVTLIGPGG